MTKTLAFILGIIALSVASPIGNEFRSDPCDACETFAADLAYVINGRLIQKGLQVFLNKACALIPNEKNAQACSETVNNSIGKITDFIGNKILAPENCKNLFHCDLFDATRDFSLCKALETVYNTIPVIVDQAEEICDELPIVENQQTCHDTFAKYKPQVEEIAQNAVKWISDHIPFTHCDLPQFMVQKQQIGNVLRTDPCEMCEKFAGDLATVINNKLIQKGLQVFLNKACGLIPNKKNADACSETVNNYITTITDFIGNKVLAPENCKTLLHCDLIDSSRDFSICDVLDTIYDTIPKIVDQAEEICDELPVKELQQTCHDTFAKYKPQVEQIAQNAVKWISTHIPFVHCDSHNLVLAQDLAVGQVLRSDPCKICERITGDLATLINNKLIQKGLQVFLNKACELLPDKNADACQETVNNYIDKITGFISRKVLNPTNCKNVYHCDVLDASRNFSICDTLTDIYNQIPEIVEEAEEICDELPVVELQQTCHDTFAKYKPQVEQIAQNAIKWISDHIPFVHCNIAQFSAVLPHASVLRTDPCKICETLSGDLSTLISQKWIQKGLQLVLDKACALLPNLKNAEACAATVEGYIDKITDFIDLKVLNPANCKNIYHCDLIDSTRDFSLCDTLSNIYHEIPKIVDQAEEVCDEIPVVELQETCHDTFTRYTPQVEQIAQNVVKWIAEHIPFMHCNIEEQSTLLMADASVLRSDPCKMCDKVIGEMSAFVQNGFVEEGIRKLFIAECSLIPVKKTAESCTETVNTYMYLITQYLANNILTSDNCVKILHCDDIDATRDFSICNALLTFYGDMMVVVEQAEGICDELPVVEVQHTCHQIFDKYSPQIAKMGQKVVKFVGTHIPFVHCKMP